jgi:hypothetical protein
MLRNLMIDGGRRILGKSGKAQTEMQRMIYES